LAHAAGEGLDRIEITVDLSDEAQIGILASFGFQVTRDETVETWMDIGDRPPVSPLDPRYRLATRRETGSRPHHMTGRSGADVEERLGQTSLYRRSEEHTSELQSRENLVCRLLLEKKNPEIWVSDT